MAMYERNRLEELVNLAREIAGQLTSLRSDEHGNDEFAMRLAQAHALGLVDQLSEMARLARPAVTAQPAVPLAAERIEETEVLH